MTIAEKKLRSNENLLIFMCLFMYLMMMAAKSIFTSEIEVVSEVFGTKKSVTSLANLYYYATYALMQVVLVFLLDKINIKIYLGITVTISALISISIGVVGSIGAEIGFIFVMFTINGFMQAGIYGCSIKLFNKYLSKEYFFKGVKLLSVAQIIATVLSYGLSSLFVAIDRWALPFIIIGGAFMGSALIFVLSVGVVTKNIENYRLQEEAEKHEEHKVEKLIPLSKQTKKTLVVFLGIVSVITVLGNSAHYGLNTWFTTLLKQQYGFPAEYGILLTMGVSLILSVVSMVSIGYCAKAKNYYLNSVLVFVGAMIFALALAFLFDKGIVFAAVFSVIFLMLNRWAKVPYSSVTSYKLRACMEPGKYSLLINAVASVAAGVGPTAMSLIFESFGWGGAYIAVAIMCFVVIVMVLLAMLFDKKLLNGVEKDKQNLENK